MQNFRATSKPVLSTEVGIGKTAIDNNLTQLKDLGIITRIGSDKAGHWQINMIPIPTVWLGGKWVVNAGNYVSFL